MRSFPINPLRTLAGTDPGLERLTNALGVAAAVLLSACGTWLIVRLTHSDVGFLSIGAFLALQVGLGVKDKTSRDRIITTAVLAIPATAALTVAVLLSRWRPVEIAVFIGVAGGATWARKYGPRASAIGMIAFFAYFFALFLKPSVDQLPTLFLIVVTTVASHLIVRTVLMQARPTRSLRLLMREFSAAGATSLAAATTSDPDIGSVHRRLDRNGDVAGAIYAWQESNDTAAHIGVSEHELHRLVFDARTDLVQACLAAARSSPTDRRSAAPQIRSLAQSLTVGAPPTDAPDDARDPDGMTATLLVRAIESQHALRAATDTIGTPNDEPDPGPDPFEPSPPPAAAATPTAREEPTAQDGPTAQEEPTVASPWWEWREWEPTSRMAIQVMVGCAFASIVGEAISASRWYWAVLTAFLVFVGTSTRAAILTRAYRRVLGTGAGVVVGLGLILLADHTQGALIAICVVSVFGMLYFGPITYSAMAFFVTVLLTSIFGLLGVLNREVLQWRVEETLTGAAIGVACAFLVFSTSSRPVLAGRIQDYFGALDAVLEASAAALTARGGTDPVLVAIRTLDGEYGELKAFASGMWVAFPVSNQSGLRRAVTDLITAATIHTDRLAQEALTVAGSTSGPGPDPDATEQAIARVRAQAVAAATHLLHRPSAAPEPAVPALDAINRVHPAPHTPEFRAILALSQLSSVLQHLQRLRGHR